MKRSLEFHTGFFLGILVTVLLMMGALEYFALLVWLRS